MFNFSQQPQSIGRIFGDGVRLFKTTFSKVWYWQLLWLIPIIIPSLINFPGLDKIQGTTPTAGNELINHGGISLLIIGLVIFVVLLIISLFGHCFNFHRIYTQVTQPNLDAKYSLKIAAKKIPTVVGATLLILVGFSLVQVLTVGLFMLLWHISGFLAVLAAVVIALPLILAAFFVLLLLSFYIQLIVLDDCGVIQAIKQSCKLVWGNWWRNFIILLGLSIASGVLSLISALIPNPIISIIVDVAILVVLYPWYASTLLVQFNDLKRRHLGFK